MLTYLHDKNLNKNIPCLNIYCEIYFRDFILIEYEQVAWSKMVESLNIGVADIYCHSVLSDRFYYLSLFYSSTEMMVRKILCFLTAVKFKLCIPP